MEYFFYSCLFVFGTLFGSFGSVIIYRLKSSEGGIIGGRSHCGSCNTMLKAIDLIPIVSWVINKAKCKYCMKKVSNIYPILEIAMGLIFASIGYFLIDYYLIFTLDTFEIFKMFFWLSIGFISILYIFYDILFLEIHEGMLLTGIGIIFLGVALQTLFPSINLIEILPSGVENLWVGIGAIVLSLGIIGALYLIMLKEYHEAIDSAILLGTIGLLFTFGSISGVHLGEIAILNGIIGVFIIFIFFFIQIVISGGAWMGGGDLRIAIMIGLILGINYTFPGLMITYLSGSIIGITVIILDKIKNGKGKSKLNTQIPFGPFLAIGFFLTVFYSQEISKLINFYL